LNPPELLNSSKINVEAAHTYMLGSNLYHYLINKDVVNSEEPPKYVFTSPIFKTPQGQLFEDLITKMTQKEPSNRISLNDALVQLDSMQKQCKEMMAVQQVIHELRCKKSWLGQPIASAMKKAQEIEVALNNMPYEKLTTVLSDSEANPVQLALAQHRHILARLFNQNPAQSFTELKKRFKEAKPEPNGPVRPGHIGNKSDQTHG
jgi:serine/threonine protein kinase